MISKTRAKSADCPAVHGGGDVAELRELGISPSQIIDFSSNLLAGGPSNGVVRSIDKVKFSTYPDPECTDLRTAIAKRYRVPIQRIVCGNGCSELIHHAALAVIAPQDDVLIIGPTFSEYERASRLVGANVHRVESDSTQQFAVPVEEVDRRLMRDHFSAVWICNPNNPTGKTITRDVLVRWIADFPKTWFLVDESYAELCDTDVSLLDQHWENLVVLRSLTKSHSLAGLRLGFAVANPEVMCKIQRVPWSVNAFSMAAGISALGDVESMVKRRGRMQRERRVLLDQLTSHGFSFVPTTTNFVLVHVGDADSVRRRLLLSGVLVRSGASFGVPDYIRVSVQSRSDNARLVELLDEQTADGGDVGQRSDREFTALDDTDEIHPFAAGFQSQLKELFCLRRDVRQFLKRPVPAGTIKACIEAACLAPSVGLSQPWRFVSVQSDEMRDKVIQEFEEQNEKAAAEMEADSASEYRQLKLAGLREAPEHLAVFVQENPEQGRGLGRATMPQSVAYSVVAAIQNFWLAARSEGIGVGWVSILRPDRVREILDVPKSWTLIAYLCVGYPEHDRETTPELQRRGWECRAEISKHWIKR